MNALSYHEARVLHWAMDHQRLPTQREIAAATGMSVTTVNKMLGILAHKGVLARTDGGQYAVVKEA